MRGLLIVVAAFIVALAPARAAEEQLEFEYSRFSRITERLAGAGKYDRIIVRIRAFVPGKQIEPGKLVFTILAKSGPRELRPDEQGYLVIPNDPLLNKENPKVRVNVPKTVEVSFNVQIRFRVTPGTAVPYAEIAECLKQMNAAIGEQAGLMSFMAPSAKGVRFRCGADCVATLTGGKPDQIKADKAGNVDVYDDIYRKVPNLVVTLSAPHMAVIPIIK